MSSRYDAAPATARAPAATTELIQIVRVLQSPRARGHITATTHARAASRTAARPRHDGPPRAPHSAQGTREGTRAKNARGVTLMRTLNLI
jgi:hypothetical protein